jgi:hypothetical protein
MNDIVTAIHASIEIVNRLRKLSKKIEDAAFKMLLAGLSNELADAKLDAANLKIELAQLKEQHQEQALLLERRSTEKPIVCEGAYQFDGDSGFFCTACYDVRQQKVRVTALPSPFSEMGTWQCPSCQAILGAPSIS